LKNKSNKKTNLFTTCSLHTSAREPLVDKAATIIAWYTFGIGENFVSGFLKEVNNDSSLDENNGLLVFSILDDVVNAVENNRITA
jgi:hypothetical protein